MGVNIDEILASLEQEKTAEANFADNISSEAPTENVSDSPETEATPEAPVSNDTVGEDEIAKIAAECDAQGRIMARAFVNEINKVAAEEGEEYYEGSETSEPVYEEEAEYTDQDGAEYVEEETEKEAEEYDPANAIVGQLYNDYFGGEE